MNGKSQVKVGIIGCGVISNVYIKNLKNFDILEVAACADLVIERAQAKAKEFDIPKACTVEELLADSDIQIVVNLTIPNAHAQITKAAMAHGKHVYVEKPLAVSLADGREIVRVSETSGLLVGCAPETFLGGGLQTCRKLIDDGWIGKPVAASAFMLSHGTESWHPNPEFFYQPGGGPMFDMGPYYLTALINLIGPVRRVTGSTQVTFPERTITSKEKYGSRIQVNTPTHIAGVLDFASGAIGTIITSFDVWSSEITRKIEIYVTEGTLIVPDPNTFGGPVRIRRAGADEWSEVPLTHGYIENSRGIAVADMAYAVLHDRAHRANANMALHVLELMHGFHISSDTGRHYELSTTCDRPAPLPTGLFPWTLDA